MFGDPKLVSEETKLQLSADLDKPAPAQYQEVGLRFEFGRTESKHSADIVVFTGAGEHTHDVMAAPVGLDPSGYLPRVSGYEDSRCGVDFVTSFDRKAAWFDAASDMVPCPGQPPIATPADVWLTALELLPMRTDAVFLLTGNRQSRVYWQLDSGSIGMGKDDGFGRVVAPLETSGSGTYTLHYGPNEQSLGQEVCFHAFRP